MILPAKYRASFDTQAFLTQHVDKCLALWTPEEFERQIAEREASQDRSADDRNTVRVWASKAVDVEMDRQGRVAIPPYLRTFAGLAEGQPVLITGALNRIELWNPAEWAARVAPSESNFTDPPPDSPVATPAASDPVVPAV
jgi:MraZ protein